MTESGINVKKLTQEFLDAGLPLEGLNSKGEITYTRELTKSEKTKASSLIAAHDPTPTTEEARQEAYLKAGITTQKMIFALWKLVIKSESHEADALLSEMTTIDQTIN